MLSSPSHPIQPPSTQAASKSQNITGGCYTIGTVVDDENESFEIEDELLAQMADIPQDPSIKTIRKGCVAEEVKAEEE